MKVANLMSRDVPSCRTIDTLEQASEVMSDHDLEVLPVVDEQGYLVGTVSNVDLRMSAYFRSLPLQLISVESVMKEHPLTCSLDDEVEDVTSRMRDRELLRIPVVDAEGHAVGIVSLEDLGVRGSSVAPGGGVQGLRSR